MTFTVGQRMKARRKELGLNAEYVAQLLGVSPATVYRYEKGDIEKLPGEILSTLATILQTTPAYLMGWEESPDENPSAENSSTAFDGRPRQFLSEYDSLLLSAFHSADDSTQSAIALLLHIPAPEQKKESIG